MFFMYAVTCTSAVSNCNDNGNSMYTTIHIREISHRSIKTILCEHEGSFLVEITELIWVSSRSKTIFLALVCRIPSFTTNKISSHFTINNINCSTPHKSSFRRRTDEAGDFKWLRTASLNQKFSRSSESANF